MHIPSLTHRPARARIRWSSTARLAVAGLLGGLVVATVPAVGPASAAAKVSCDGDGLVSGGVLSVASGETCTVSSTTTLDELVIGDGGSVVAPDGSDVTLTVDGIETGQAFDSVDDVTGTLQPGDYVGEDDGGVVLTVTNRHTGTNGGLTFPIRQSLYVDADGVDDAKSVPASWLGRKPGGKRAKNFKVASTGSTFNGIWVDGADYTITDPEIELTGNGRSDFVASGSGITGANGADVTVDGADIRNDGVVRTAVIAESGANVVVKNSTIDASGGDLPSDYTMTVDTAYMMAAPWMLGIEGTNRATNIMGADTRAAYVNSDLHAEDWGVLSTEGGSDMELTSINNTVSTGDSGYGSYAIGGVHSSFLGTDFDVDDYGVIAANGANVVHFGDSDAASVADLNTDREIGLSDEELAALDEQTTTVNSGRVGVMTWAGDSTIDIDGGTVFNTGGPVFEDKTSTSNNKVIATYNVTGDDESAPSLTPQRASCSR